MKSLNEMKKIHFKIALKRIKYLGITLTKEVPRLAHRKLQNIIERN